MISNYPHRTLCDVFSEMWALHKTRNYASLLALVEEAQSMANRMEAGLYYQKDIEALHKERKRLKASIKEMECRC